MSKIISNNHQEAVVVGGSNGIGLAISRELIKQNYHVNIIDRVAPNTEDLTDAATYTYIHCNLIDFDEEVIKSISENENINVLMITAGFGRVSDFEYIHTAEIDNMFKVNTVAAIKIISLFYKRIKSDSRFYCGVMGSIAGLVCSPAFSVYSASKAAICKFIESVNIELEVNGYKNRILNVSPGSIKGTKFNGGENDILQLETLAQYIVKRLFEKEELFIPDYDTVYKDVIERYINDPHTFGVSSYEYKKQSGRCINKKCVAIGYLSGTFDLFHVGHLNLIKRAKQECDYLIVGVHPNAKHKNKETFIPFDERMKVVGACKYVDKVVKSCSEDSDAWDLWHYNKLFVGSDYKGTERFERYEQYFSDKNVSIIYLPYTKGTSSTQIREKIKKYD